MRISAEKTRCIGAGHCVRAAPDLFDADEDGLVTVSNPDPDPSRADILRDVVGLCPNAAITLQEDP
ncbi:ferredoxin [Saccharopolyspora phatthalungensis]|uniref:Ferredoxin n=1 Tax=Saccharopolyspora phatthalungensis TaxID=664693 RepID=A0A840QEB1_9PSEU|nr:ferredoxin [Saccharopolyspora phatthalungensis]MBB5158766.1 ferredoxin [Saccharopolyspora phatthalungensis]